ncbi:MAG: 1,4-beta-xylanase [Flavobacteriaceae bacterium]|nr:1,4-beta-xylanase [Flavobacteriaceae bacterium]|tara:strand:- start:1487 stop:2593 length:1107 start_codon:yes stop_codon:yes gene_type:complete
MKKIFLVYLLSFQFFACAQNNISLKEKFSSLFLVGAVINQEDYQILDKDPKIIEIVQGDFNALTPENSMKWMHIHPNFDKYTFSNADKIVKFSENNDMYLLGHTLLWHNQVPSYVYDIRDKITFENHVKKHITTVVNRYSGKVDMWDVVNEALEDDGSLRKTVFFEMMGENYIEKAFKFANEIDPDVALAYNDYNLYKPDKRKGAIRIIKSLKDKGIRIDAVGIQAHWDLDFPSIELIEETIIELASTGVDVMITELDITVIPNPWALAGINRDEFKKFEGDKKWNPYENGLPKNIEKKLTKRYQDIFKLFVKHSDKISRVTFWGTTDKYTWRNDNPIRNRVDYPLLFDRDYNKKLAYDAIMDIKIKK